MPIAVIIIAVATPILLREGSRIKKNFFDEEVPDDELEKIEPVLEDLGLYSDDICTLNTEQEVSDIVKAQLQDLDSTGQDKILNKLKKCLYQDEYFIIEQKKCIN